MSEEDLDRRSIELCLAGDVDAFGTLIDRYERPVFNAIIHMVRNYDDADEICQQVFMKAFEHLSSFDRERKFFSWIYRLAMNESINHLKAKRAWEPLDESMETSQPNAHETLESSETTRQVREAVMGLDAIYRAVVVLRHFLGFSYEEAAEALQLPVKTVKSRLFTARQLLRVRLEEKGFAGSY